MVPEIKNILYATDLSENACYALKYALAVARRFSAQITVLHVIEELSSINLGLVSEIVGEKRWADLRTQNETKVVESLRLRIKGMCAEIGNDFPECLLIENIIVKVGHPVDQIIYYAEKTDCDMVVMGSRGQGMLAGAMLGSTSTRVLRRCSKPVLVIRLPKDHPPAL